VRLSPAERERVFAAVSAERRSIATLIDGLDTDQLATASLCVGWDVKTVAAHLVSDFADGFWGFMASGLRHGSIDRGIDALARRRAQAPAAEIAEMLRRRADYRLSPPVTGPLSGLTDVLVHGADMRIPLGLPHRPDPHNVARVLEFIAGYLHAGHHWYCDPKYIVTLVVLLLYAAYIQLARTTAWRGARASKLCVFNFILVVLSFTVVNLYFSSHHRFF
jgi:uncharacterized protein (TIGR03083 family)